MKNFILTIIASLCVSHVAALYPSPVESRNSTAERRAANTCGDPSVATTYFYGFNVVAHTHSFNTEAAFINSYASGNNWQSTTPAFRAWLSAGQLSTVPLYSFENNFNVVYILSTNGNAPPAPAGYKLIDIVGYVYPTQICSSVPLYAATLGTTDHWYTTTLSVHDQLVSRGWTDAGILAYVLPLDDCTCSS